MTRVNKLLLQRSVVLFVTLAGCGGGVAGSTMKITVTSHDDVSNLSTPLAGANVAVDLPDGKRVEALADANGVASVGGIDWEKGTVDVTAYAADHTVFSELAVAKTDALDMTLGSTLPPATVNVGGNLGGKQGANDMVTLSATAPGSTFYQDATTSYSMSVGSDAAFSLVGLDWVAGGGASVSNRGVAQTFLKWARLDQPAASADVTVDFNFASAPALTPTSVSGHMDIPGGTGGALAKSVGYFSVTTMGSVGAAFLGAPVHMDVNSAGSGFDWVGEYVKLDGITPLSQYEIFNSDGSGTIANVMAYPSDADQLTDLLPVPDAPATATTLANGASFDNAPSSLSWVSLHLTVGTAPTIKVAWVVRQKSGPWAALKVPALPTGADPATVFGSAHISGQIRYCGAAISDDLCGRTSLSRPFDVTQ